jgi:carboxymethylenebutenolidase
MCHDPSDRPPAPPVDVADLDSSGSLELTSADGTVFAAYEAVPTGEPHARVVLLPDVRGLHPYYRALTEQLAEAGLYAVAVDYFGRTAGASLRGDDFDHREHVAAVTPEQVEADVSAAVHHVAPEGDAPVFALGFCFGGGHAWRLAARRPDGRPLAGAIGFYGRLPLLEEVGDELVAPVLMLVAGEDRATPARDAQALAARLRERGKDVEDHLFEGMPHSFFDRDPAEHEEATTRAWRVLLAFVERHSREHGETAEAQPSDRHLLGDPEAGADPAEGAVPTV